MTALTREDVLHRVGNKYLRDAIIAALDLGWVPHQQGKRIKFTHEEMDHPVFVGTNTTGTGVDNFVARISRVVKEIDNELSNIEEASWELIRLATTDDEIDTAKRGLLRAYLSLPVHSSHVHYEHISSPKLRRHINERHGYKAHFRTTLKHGNMPDEHLPDLHDLLHDGRAIHNPVENHRCKHCDKPIGTEQYEELARGNGEVHTACFNKWETAKIEEMLRRDEVVESTGSSKVMNGSSNTGSSTSASSEDSSIKPDSPLDTEEPQRHFGSMQRAVLAVLHEHPGASVSVEEVTNLCMDDLSKTQVNGALWRCSQIEALRVERVADGVYRYNPPSGAPNLAMIEYERPPTPTQAARSVPVVDAPPPEPPAPVRDPGAPASSDTGDGLLFELVLKAEDGTLVLKATDGTFWNARQM